MGYAVSGFGGGRSVQRAVLVSPWALSFRKQAVRQMGRMYLRIFVCTSYLAVRIRMS
jgi:hypothetical protein